MRSTIGPNISEATRMPKLSSVKSEPASALLTPNRVVISGRIAPSDVNTMPNTSIPMQATANTAR
jgi:hypothetical protein